MTGAKTARSKMRSSRFKSGFPHWEFDFDAPISIVGFSLDRAILALGDGTIQFWTAGETNPACVQAHRGAILCAVMDDSNTGIITGGDDGRLVHTFANGRCELLASSDGRWIEQVARQPGGALSWSQGRTVEVVLAANAGRMATDLPTSCEGLSFEPNGGRLAAAHYGGVTLLSHADGRLEHDLCTWKGSHIAVSWSPDARFLVSAMQEAALHVWRLSDRRDLHMGGYPAKPRGLSWSADGAQLATTGAPGALTWFFDGEDGPEGRNAELLAERDELATAIAWHPKTMTLAVGFRDGLVLVSEPGSLETPFLRAPDGDRVVGLAWQPDGHMLAWGTEGGSATIIDLSKARP